MKNKFTALLLIFALALTTVLGSVGTAAAATSGSIEEVFKKTGDYIYETVKEPTCDSIGGDWAMYGLGMADYPLSKEYVATYQSNVEKAVKEGYRGVPGQLHDRKYTEYSRVIAAYTVIGLDPRNIAGYNFLEKLADFDKVVWQGINGPIWALRALDLGNYEIPAVSDVKNVTTRQKLIDHIVNAQLADGGWNLNVNCPEDKDFEANKKTQQADPDITGMALSALAPYRAQAKVKTAISKGVSCLSKMQNESGSFTAWGATSAESIAQAICGLTAVGINPNADRRFIKGGKSLVDALFDFYDDKTGGFRHVNEASGGYQPVVNQMATEQAYYALASYMNTVPTKAELTKVAKAGAGALKATWKQAPKGTACSGYQVTVAANSKFSKGVKKVFAVGSKKTTAKVSKLKKGTTYYVKVRAYKKVNGVKLYGAYSKAKKVRV